MIDDFSADQYLWFLLLLYRILLSMLGCLMDHLE